MTGRPPCQVLSLGLVEYCRAWNWQQELVSQVRNGSRPNTLLLLEHPPVYTRGRLARPEHLLVTDAELRARKISVVDTDRGGQITYHGPGQLVAYPIVNLREWGGPLKYVRTLEQVIIDVLADFGIAAGSEPGLTGVWAGPAKIAAIGVKISRGIAHHGLALNINPDLSRYAAIVPCGIADRPVTSMFRLLGAATPTGAAVRQNLAQRFCESMGYRLSEAQAPFRPLDG